MRARVNFPLDRDRQHLTAGDRDKVSEGKKDKTAVAKGCVRIARDTGVFSTVGGGA
jgi:hypothetical protein